MFSDFKRNSMLQAMDAYVWGCDGCYCWFLSNFICSVYKTTKKKKGKEKQIKKNEHDNENEQRKVIKPTTLKSLASSYKFHCATIV